MPNPQNPELRRSEETMRPRPELGPEPHDVGGEGGPVPPDNQPGHHPAEDQDKPPADKFAEALGIKSDTELAEEAATEETEAPPRTTKRTAKRQAAKKAPARKAAAKKAAGGPAAAPAATPAADKPARAAARPAAETPISPAPTPATTATSASTPAPEQAEQVGARHHHAAPDDELPHDAGMVTPSGAPVTVRVLQLPLRYCGVVLRTGGGFISAYGQVVQRLGERLTPGRR